MFRKIPIVYIKSLVVAFFMVGCYGGNSKIIDSIENTKVLSEIDTKKYRLETKNKDNTKVDRYILLNKDNVFSTVLAITNEEKKVLRKIYIKNCHSADETRQAFNETLKDLQDKYGTFNCRSDNTIFESKDCFTMVEGNLISVYYQINSETPDVVVNVINKKYNDYNPVFKQKFDNFK